MTAVYVRVSTQRQAQAETVEQQLDRLRAHLRDQGVELASEKVFRDDGYGGATLNRPGLDRLRDATRGGRARWTGCWSPPPTAWRAATSSSWCSSRSWSASAARSRSWTGRW